MALSQLRRTYLDLLEDHWSEHGTYPYPLKSYVMEKEFREAMEYRSLPLPKSQTLNLNQSSLDPTQRAVIRSVTNYHDTRPLRTKLKEFGVDTKLYQSWLKDPWFKNHLDAHLTRNQAHLPNDAKLALSNLILSNDLNAIKYYHELSGIYRPNSETLLNLSLILAKLMDILSSYLGPKQLNEVADKLENVVLGVSGGGESSQGVNVLLEAVGIEAQGPAD